MQSHEAMFTSTFQATDEVEISIVMITDAFFDDYESYVEFCEDYAIQQRIAFVPNIILHDFRFIEINGAEIEFIVERDLFVLDTLHPEQPLVMTWMARGSAPHRGIAFTDENGLNRYFMFHYDARGVCAFRFAEFTGDLTLECYDRWDMRHIESISPMPIYHIPFWSNGAPLYLSAERASAFAEIVRSVEDRMRDFTTNYTMLYPVLIDVSGDGVPLLLLVTYRDGIQRQGSFSVFSSNTEYSNLLFGFADGEVQQLTWNTAISITEVEGEQLLTVGWVSDFGGYYDFYRIQSGAATFVMRKTFVSLQTWHTEDGVAIHTINDVDFAPEEYWEIRETIPTTQLMPMWHSAQIYVSPEFIHYLFDLFPIERVIRTFENFAMRN